MNQEPTIIPSPVELRIIEQVKMKQQEDRNVSPFSSRERWYMRFSRENSDSIDLSKAPANKLLMVVSESLSTLYSSNRGIFIMRGSILIKVNNETVYCVDAYSWYGGGGTPHIFPVKGYYSYTEELGKVKEVININI